MWYIPAELLLLELELAPEFPAELEVEPESDVEFVEFVLDVEFEGSKTEKITDEKFWFPKLSFAKTLKV